MFLVFFAFFAVKKFFALAFGFPLCSVVTVVVKLYVVALEFVLHPLFSPRSPCLCGKNGFIYPATLQSRAALK